MGFVSKGIGDAVETAATDAGYAARALQLLGPALAVRLPPALLPRAGRVVERLLDAGYSLKQASNAVTALYVSRDTLTVARLWGLFDPKREGQISIAAFDRAMLLLSEVATPADLVDMRQQLGSVDASTINLREFEAALQTLIPADGAAPHSISTQERWPRSRSAAHRCVRRARAACSSDSPRARPRAHGYYMRPHAAGREAAARAPHAPSRPLHG